jgi:hypothetical protein
MSARLLAIAGVVLALGTACGSGSGITLRQVRSAFNRNGLPLTCVWQKGETSPSGAGCYGFVNGVRRGQPGYTELVHEIGYAYTQPVLTHKLKTLMFKDPKAFAKRWAKGRGAAIYTSSAFAKLAAARARRDAPSGDAVLVARNVVYVGPPSAAARRAMKELVGPD